MPGFLGRFLDNPGKEARRALDEGRLDDAQSMLERLAVEPDEIDSGHCPALSRPHELAALLDGYVSSAG